MSANTDRYRKTPKGKAANKRKATAARYRKTAKAKARDARYKRSAKGKVALGQGARPLHGEGAKPTKPNVMPANRYRGQAGLIIKNGLERLQMTISADACEEISRLSQGLPYITHLLALHSTRAAIQKGRTEIRTVDVDAGIKAALDQWQQSIISSYYHATKSQQPGHIYREVLLACALAETDDLGYFAAADVRGPLRQITGRSYDIPNFARHLKELSEVGRGDMLSRTGEKRRLRYRFNGPLMRPYIVMRGFSEQLLTRDDMKALGRN